MKKLFFLALISICLTVNAQDENLPENIVKAFSDKYPNLKIDNWTNDKDLFYLEFYLKGSFYTTAFNPEGQWVETSEIISDSDIPTLLKDYINRNYSGGEIAYSEKVESPKSVYFIRVNYNFKNANLVIKCSLNGNNIVTLNNEE